MKKSIYLLFICTLIISCILEKNIQAVASSVSSEVLDKSEVILEKNIQVVASSTSSEVLAKETLNWGLYIWSDFVGCGPNVTPLMSRHQTKEQCKEAGKKRFGTGAGSTSWCCTQIKK